MSSSYYDRDNIVHLDGTRIFGNQEDRDNEDNVSVILEKSWRCKLHRFGSLSPIDWFAERDGRVVGLLDLKSRSHEHTKFPTVFLNVRKWLALSLGSVGLGCPSLFAVKFIDGVRWISIGDIDATKIAIGGCSKIVKSHSDIEPVIHVPVLSMKELGKNGENQ